MDPHPTCARCRGKCSSDVTCDILRISQWRSGKRFLKKRSYSGRRKFHLSGSALPHAPLPIPPSTSASSEAGHRSPSQHPSSLPSEGRGYAEKLEGVSCVGSRDFSPPPSRSLVGDGGGGALAPQGSWLLGTSVALLLPLPREWG